MASTFPTEDDDRCPYLRPDGCSRRWSKKNQKWYCCNKITGRWIKWLTPDGRVDKDPSDNEGPEPVVEAISKKRKISENTNTINTENELHNIYQTTADIFSTIESLKLTLGLHYTKLKNLEDSQSRLHTDFQKLYIILNDYYLKEEKDLKIKEDPY